MVSESSTKSYPSIHLTTDLYTDLSGMAYTSSNSAKRGPSAVIVVESTISPLPEVNDDLPYHLPEPSETEYTGPGTSRPDAEAGIFTENLLVETS